MGKTRHGHLLTCYKHRPIHFSLTRSSAQSLAKDWTGNSLFALESPLATTEQDRPSIYPLQPSPGPVFTLSRIKHNVSKCVSTVSVAIYESQATRSLSTFTFTCNTSRQTISLPRFAKILPWTSFCSNLNEIFIHRSFQSNYNVYHSWYPPLIEIFS